MTNLHRKALRLAYFTIAYNVVECVLALLAGAAAAAEIGTMKVTEQIDALYTMRIDPQQYLISPRIAAAIISFPLLTAFFDLIGIRYNEFFEVNSSNPVFS